MVMLLHMLVAAVWASTMVIHTRRLMRLACVNQLRRWEKERLRSGLSRIWWWLGQDEFWRGLSVDTLRSIELTLMIFLVALAMSV
jgi:hypothetical protein